MSVSINTAVAGGVGGGAGPNLTLNPTQITASRALTAADFTGGILVINAAGVVAITVPTLAVLGLSTAFQWTAAFRNIGAGIPTFAGATAGTSINGVAGTTTVLPLGGAPVQNGDYLLGTLGVGTDTWNLE